MKIRYNSPKFPKNNVQRTIGYQLFNGDQPWYYQNSNTKSLKWPNASALGDFVAKKVTYAVLQASLSLHPLALIVIWQELRFSQKNFTVQLKVRN